MKKGQELHAQIIFSTLLLALWVSSALHKLMHFDTFRADILRQPFSDGLGQVLVYSLPVVEVAVVFLLISGRCRWVGYGLSSLLMAAFTTYVGLAWIGAWTKLPCGCGKLIAWMSWGQHFWFNLFFLLISVFGWVLHHKRLHNIISDHGKDATSCVSTATDITSTQRLQKNNDTTQ